ncbi:MAG: hypothetical protein EWV61_05025, partial [Microcystis aeruginosa Ma_AC_P_19900807_S300]
LVCAVSVSLYRFQLLLGVGTLIEFYFKLIICITIPEEPFISTHIANMFLIITITICNFFIGFAV